MAHEYTVSGDTSSEWWTDYAPNDESPYEASDPNPSDPTDPDDPTDISDPTGSTGDTSESLTDPANDVYMPGGQTGISNQQHLDIREITYTFDDS